MLNIGFMEMPMFLNACLATLQISSFCKIIQILCACLNMSVYNLVYKFLCNGCCGVK